jgi:hypothetical protein
MAMAARGATTRRPFDERRGLCDNGETLPAQRLIAVLAVLAASACGRANDLPRMQDEVLATAVSYQGRFDELKQRADAADARLRALPQDTASAAARHQLELARTTIAQDLGQLQQVPTLLPAWMRSENPRELMAGWLDTRRAALEAGLTEATSEIAAVESWAAAAEQRGGAPAAPAAPPPAAETAPDDREPQTDGSGAPIR